MQDAEVIPALEAVLKDLSPHPIVRHEAAEALEAIGLQKSIPLLEESLAADPAVEVQETCELALRRIEEQKNTSALPAKQGLSVEQPRELLLNEQESMLLMCWVSYKTKLLQMHFLTVLKNDDEHPMVRHEAAEALGSIADQESIALLEESAKDAEPIVSQNCEVALSMLEYERSGKSFEFLFL
ncbi:hypothetical protein E2562_031182 [Oryza meyeriana var. granulata]|uniref:Deoxyhypusine monooxygenase n=1 Tax=Oryza meyeriana var. granulata TaxID=110450 RepID=A0A6G1ERK4_9ORYZ|nr:hypothetical protein E2562_031182 [Oryza meyeriana var. granulata]